MKTRAAVMWEAGKPWDVVELELDPPKAGEVLIKFAASGLCHSDDHARTGDLPGNYPLVGGHEGAGCSPGFGRRADGVRVHPSLRAAALQSEGVHRDGRARPGFSLYVGGRVERRLESWSPMKAASPLPSSRTS